ncbi:MAG: DUF1800 domain-containing protein [Anaerolineae bacterium]|nr:DUF1800 domain-containing protein [Anaerolineae bacterium]
MNRRQFLAGFGVGAVALSAGAVTRALAALPVGVLAPAAEPVDAAAHAINRLTYGVTPDLYMQMQRTSPEAFIAQQLDPFAIDDSEAEARLNPWKDILSQTGGALFAEYEDMRGQVGAALIGGVAARALYSQRQLYERMVYFFSNHFHIFIEKGPTLFLKVDDDRETIRPNAMTTFRQILGASAKSPAMLVYLDNAQNNRRAPNENYARELLELHTLGVNGGYSEEDVKEVARAFTGWSVRGPREGGDTFAYFFRRTFHDDDAKTILGVTLPAGGGESDGDRVLDLLAAHPSTARFVGEKLARRFVSDDPPAALVSRLADAFLASGGDVTTLLRTLFAAPEFWSAPPKLKQPLEAVISMLRALAFDLDNPRQFVRGLHGLLAAMGQVPFAWPAPNGYPDVAGHWRDGLINRWNTALLASVGGMPGGQAAPTRLLLLLEENAVPLETDAVLDFLGRYLLGRPLTSDEHAIVMDFARNAGTPTETQIVLGLALLLASPAFQYR